MPARSLVRRLLLLSCAALMLTACGGEPEPGTKTYVGRIPQSDLFVGLAVDGERILALVTDGEESAVWFTGTLEGNSMYLTAQGDSRLSGRIVDDTVEGTVTMGGRSYDVDARLATEQGGLYRSEGGGRVTAWIVLPDGSQKGVQTSGDDVSRAPRLEVFAA